MTRARRDRRKAAERERGGHSVADHRPMPEDPEHPGRYLPVKCPKCRKPSPHLDQSVEAEVARKPAAWRS